MKPLLVILSLAAGSASAAGFPDLSHAPETCYSWEGGYKSSGSFMHCGAPLVTTVVEAPMAQAKPVVVQPIVQTTTCPPPVVLERETPPAKKAIKRAIKRKVVPAQKC